PHDDRLVRAVGNHDPLAGLLLAGMLLPPRRERLGCLAPLAPGLFAGTLARATTNGGLPLPLGFALGLPLLRGGLGTSRHSRGLSGPLAAAPLFGSDNLDRLSRGGRVRIGG